MLRLRVLGHFRLQKLDGSSVELKGLRDRALLVFLALQGGPQTREKITGLLWEDRPEAQARQSLRQSLSALRRVGVPVLADGKSRLALGPGISCDAADFRAAAAGKSRDELRRAIDLHEGGVFADWHGSLPAFEDWMRAERQSLAELAVATCLRLLAWDAPRPAAPERLFLARKALESDPYLETAHRYELAALGEMGLRGEATLCHRNFARRLKEDLGVEPQPETRDVLAALKTAKAPTSEGAFGLSARSRRSRLCVFGLRRPAEQEALDYLCLGIMNEIAAALSRFHSFDVIPPVSAAILEKEGSDPLRASRERAGADFALNGTISISGGAVSVNLYLHNLASGLLLWDWTSTMANPDYDTLSRMVAHAVAQRIDTRIEQEHLESGGLASRSDREGYDLWLKAQHLMLKWRPEDDDAAQALLEKALAVAPGLARAHSSLALLLNSRFLVRPGYPGDAEDRRSALEHARLALEHDPQDPRSHIAMMWVALWMCDHGRAARHAQLCHEINPFSADVLMHVAQFKANLGEAHQAIALIRQALALNPLYPDWYSYFHAVALVLARDYAGALTLGLPLADQFLELPGWLTVAAALAGDNALAARMLAKLEDMTRVNWAGPEPWTPPDAIEWFLSANRWLIGEERAMRDEGLRRLGKLP